MSIIGAFPYTLTNGTTADANQVMANYDYIQSQVNANALALVGGALTGAITSTSSANFAGQLIGAGTVAGDSAAAGVIGEIISATVSGGGSPTLITGTDVNVTSIALSAGDWDLQAGFQTNPAGGCTPSLVSAAISLTSGARNPIQGAFYFLTCSFTINSPTASTLGAARITVSAPTTVYLVVRSDFTGGTNSVSGFVSARRRR